MSKEPIQRKLHLLYHLPMYLVLQKKGAQLLMSYAIGPEHDGPPLKTVYEHEQNVQERTAYTHLCYILHNSTVQVLKIMIPVHVPRTLQNFTCVYIYI